MGPKATGVYGDAEGYDAYMGRWSAALAPSFLGFTALAQPQSLLDVGAGTGNLLAAMCATFPRTRVVGIDPSSALLERARSRDDLENVELIEGVGSQLLVSRRRF